MKLHDYLTQPGALTVSELRIATGVKSDAQIRQWRHGYADRIPGPENCVAIERATGGAVRRWDLRPEDWHRIWPELIGADGAPDVSDARAASTDTHQGLRSDECRTEGAAVEGTRCLDTALPMEHQPDGSLRCPMCAEQTEAKAA